MVVALRDRYQGLRSKASTIQHHCETAAKEQGSYGTAGQKQGWEFSLSLIGFSLFRSKLLILKSDFEQFAKIPSL